MSGSGVSEFFLRDALFASPFPIIRVVCEQYGFRIPHEIHRWKEYATSAGRIDLLIAWPGVALVIECKKGCASEAAIAQVCRYVGDLNNTEIFGLANGVVAAESFDALAINAARGANVMLVRLAPAVTCYKVDEPSTVARDHSKLVAAMQYYIGNRTARKRTLRVVTGSGWTRDGLRIPYHPRAVISVSRSGVA